MECPDMASVLSWIVSTTRCTIGRIDAIKEIVERSAFNEVARLVQCHLLGIHCGGISMQKAEGS